MMNIVVAKKFQEPAQLSDAQPFDNIDMLLECGIGFVRKSGGDNFFYAAFARGAEPVVSDKRHCRR